MRLPALLSAGLLVALGSAAAQGQAAPRQHAPDGPAAHRCIDDAAVARARRYAAGRHGTVAFAVMERGAIRSYRGGVPMRSASLVKAMLLVADLRRHAARDAPLSAADRDRLRRMITRSENAAATSTFERVGREGVIALARAAGMRRYRVGAYWSSSEITASDQARFWARLNGLLPDRFESFGRRLLRSIVHAQVWGGAPVARRQGYRTLFKSGWIERSGGWIVHQGLRLERGSCRIGLAVLTRDQRSKAAGIASLRGVVERLL